ncbi:MAG: hypothetical protein HY066_03105 [Betaproteobacteria bacterium]|nr:hypothetical protein [Betaproteobacteria bacterium]
MENYRHIKRQNISISYLISLPTRMGADGRSEETLNQRVVVRWNAALEKAEVSMVRSLPDD